MHERSLAEGSIVRGLLNFSIPFLLANVLQGIYTNVDMLVVGRFCDAVQVSAVATGGLVVSTVISLIMGLTTGGTVLIGQYFGSGQTEQIKKSIGTMFTVFMAVAVALTAVFLVFAQPIAEIMMAPKEALKDTVLYTRYCYAGLIFSMGYNIISSILRGMGDSKNPLYFILVACVSNIILDVIFVGPLEMGAAGAAIATTAAQGISFILSVLYLRRRKFVFDFRLNSFRPDMPNMKKLLRYGFPIGLQNFLACISFLIMLAVINKMGVTESATAGIGDKISMLTQMPAMAFSSAIAAFAAQNIGAGKPERARKGFYLGLGVVVAIGAVLTAALIIFPSQLASLYTDDRAIIDLAWEYLVPYGLETLAVSFAFSYSGFFTGCGKPSISMISHLVSTFLVRVPIALYFGLMVNARLLNIAIAAPVSSAAQIVILLVYMWTGKWKTAPVAVEEQAQEPAIEPESGEIPVLEE